MGVSNNCESDYGFGHKFFSLTLLAEYFCFTDDDCFARLYHPGKTDQGFAGSWPQQIDLELNGEHDFIGPDQGAAGTAAAVVGHGRNNPCMHIALGLPLPVFYLQAAAGFTGFNVFKFDAQLIYEAGLLPQAFSSFNGIFVLQSHQVLSSVKKGLTWPEFCFCMLGSVLQLPRNFSFFQRLPARFKMVVLAEGNQTADGRWYKVDISGHVLNLKSKSPLKAGQQLLIEKQTALELKVVENLSEKNPVVEQAAVTGRAGEPEAPMSQMVDQLLNLDGLLSLASLLLLEVQPGVTEISSRGRQIQFSLPLLNQQRKIEGIFREKENGWQLFIAAPEALQNEQLEDELADFLKGLPVLEVCLTSYEHLKSFQNPLDLQG